MANEEVLKILYKGVRHWNKFRSNNPEYRPSLDGVNLIGENLRGYDLTGANLSRADLSGADLEEADLSGAYLSQVDLGAARLLGADLRNTDITGGNFNLARLHRANLTEAELSWTNFTESDLSDADLSEANLRGADLREATLKRANLSGANLSRADLGEADLSDADLTDGDLNNARLDRTNLNGANLTGCFIYGISAWNVQLERTVQSNLIITDENESMITVDNLEVAQFIYLLLHNKRIRYIIDTITSKVVLILGRFTPERKRVLDAIREALRKYDKLPLLFDFEKPVNRDITETISTLAHMSRFIIADITDARSIPQELQRIVPDLPSVPVQPLLQVSADEYGMFEHFKLYPWVLKAYRYNDVEDLILSLKKQVIEPPEKKAKELEKRR